MSKSESIHPLNLAALYPIIPTMNVQLLSDKINKNKLEKYKYYAIMYNNLWTNIDYNAKNGSTDLIYTINEIVVTCPQYDPIECLEYIASKCKKNGLKIIVLSRTKIFVTWHHLTK